MQRTTFLSLALLSLAACGGGDSAGKSTTKLDAVEVEPGTISDAMIVLDNAASDGTAVDNSVPDDGTAKETEKTEGANADDETATQDDGDADPDAVEVPAAKKAVTPDTPAKKGE